MSGTDEQSDGHDRAQARAGAEGAGKVEGKVEGGPGNGAGRAHGRATDLLQAARARLWPEGLRYPFLRLGAGLLGAPAVATAIVWALAFVIAGMSEATGIGVRAVAANAAETYAVFALTLMVLAVVPAVAVLWYLGWRGLLAWVIAGLVAGAAVAAPLAISRGSGLMPAMPIGAVSALVMIVAVRWIAGVGFGKRAPARRRT